MSQPPTHPGVRPPTAPGPAPSGGPRVPGAGLWLVALTGLLAMGVVTVALTVLHAAGVTGGGSLTTYSWAATSSGDDGLRTDCAEGSMSACDQLYLESPGGSEDERFGSTCGGTTSEQYGSCDLDGGFGDDDTYAGDLYTDCADGSMSACDQLYLESPVGSGDEQFGSDCGGRAADLTGDCEEADLDVDQLDSLYAGCDAGSMSDCDELWQETYVDSDYEEFGSTCGGRSEPTAGECD